MGTKREEIEKAFRKEGCLGKAADDEPIFILRAHDKLAPSIIEHWADFAELHGASREKVEEAREVAAQMRKWPDRKFPD